MAFPQEKMTEEMSDEEKTAFFSIVYILLFHSKLSLKKIFGEELGL